MKKKYVLVLLAAFASTIVGEVRADIPYPLVSYSCLVNEDKLTIGFSISYPDNSGALYQIKKVEESCRLSSGTFKILMEYFPVPDKCGSLTTIAVSIVRGNTTILERILFGATCWSTADQAMVISIDGKTGIVEKQFRE